MIRNFLKGILILSLCVCSFSLGCYCRGKYANSLDFDLGYLECVADIKPLYIEFQNLMLYCQKMCVNFREIQQTSDISKEGNLCHSLYNLCFNAKNNIELVEANINDLTTTTLPNYTPKLNAKNWIYSKQGMYYGIIGGGLIGAGAALLHYFL